MTKKHESSLICSARPRPILAGTYSLRKSRGIQTGAIAVTGRHTQRDRADGDCSGNGSPAKEPKPEPDVLKNVICLSF